MAQQSQSNLHEDLPMKPSSSHPPPTNPEDEEGKPKLSPAKAYFKLWTYASPLDIFLRLLGTAAILAAGTALPLMTIVFGTFVNEFNGWGTGATTPDEFRKAVNKNAVYLVYIFIGRFAASYLGVMLYNATASRITRRIRLRYVDKVIHQPISYFDRHSTGSISTNLTADVNQIELGLGEKISLVFLGSSMIVTSFTIALTKNWKLALACITIVPWTITITGSLASIDTKLEARIKAIYSEASTIVEEALSSIENITALGASDKIVAHFQKYVNRAMRHVRMRGVLWSTIFGNMFFSTHAVYALCLFYGVKLVNDGEVKDGGTVLVVMFCCILGSSSLGLIAPGIPDFIKAGVAAQRILHLIEQDDSSGKGNEKNEKRVLRDLLPTSVVGNIHISGVSFAYPTRSSLPVLTDVSLDIPAGKITAIVGTSGSGKSTIIALLERWYALQEGKILLDGEDMQNYTVSSWRNVIGLVQQEPMLFNDTIFQNILNGYHGANCGGLSEKDKETLVIEAAKKANAHDFIEQLPEGYDTRVGERADQLSGGEKQRIAIARAIVSNPKILLLDEATSALDSESEKTVQEAIDSAAKGRTTVEISHSLATVGGADRIIVMDDGRAVEEGSHDGLIRIDGLYARLVRAQRSLIRDGDVKEGQADVGDAPPRPSSLQPQSTSTKRELQPSIVAKGVTRRHGIFWGIKRLVSAYPRMALPMILGLTASIGIAATFPLTAFLYSKLITVFQLQGHPSFQEKGNFWALMFFVMACCEIFIYPTVFYLLSAAGVIAGRGYRPQALQALLKQDSEFFQVDGHSSGALMTLLFADADRVEILLESSTPISTYNAINVVACGVLALAIYWKLGLVCTFACLPLVVLNGMIRMRMDNRARDRCESFFLESARFVSEAIGSVRTVASLRLEKEVIRKYNSKLDAAVSRSTKGALAYFIVYALTDSLDLLLMALLFWYGGRLLSFKELSVEQFFIIYTATLFGGQAAGFAFGYSADIAKARTALNRLFYLFDSKPPINENEGEETPSMADVSSTDTVIEFRDVHFHYPSRPNVPILRGLSFKVRKGENVCLVGRSGCGKSTIISLLERFYATTTGEILINGRPLSRLNTKKYRDKLALVGQETTLYQGTIRDNLLLGVHRAESLPDDEIAEACQQACIHDFITSLPDGYLTDCGPRGTALSGGQRQRIAIARALLRKPELLLLDEATSALDADNEALVRQALEKAGEGRTTVAAAHQMQTMEAADRIVVIEHGKVAEEGTFASLLARKGPFLRFLRDVLQK